MDLGSAGDPTGSQGNASLPVHFIQQPVAQEPEVTILQQIPWTPFSLPQPNRRGQIREDLMELMMIQNAQMHQVIMNNLAMSALAHFGISSGQSDAQSPQVHTVRCALPDPHWDPNSPEHMSTIGSRATACRITHLPWQVEDDENDDPEALVFHHHYAHYPNPVPFTAWPSQLQSSAWQQPSIRHVGLDPQPASRQDDGPVVPPPPPPSATGTVTADVLPASEYYDFTQGRF